MKKLKELLSKLTWKQITIVAPVVLIAGFCCATAYYYFTTPSNVIIVTTSDFPAGLTTKFTLNNLTDHVVARLQEMLAHTGSKDANSTVPQKGLGPKPAKENVIPIRALSGSPSPIFNLKWKGIDLNLCRYIGMSLKAKAFLELGAIGVPDKGWRLTALMKDWPNFMPQFSGSAPHAGGACPDFEKCADDLTEQILASLDNQLLLKHYIQMNTEDANRQVLSWYQTIPADSLQADDFVAWGNAFYGLNQFDQALEKYQAALGKDPTSCAARVARGFIYYSRPHGPDQLLDDLRRAEQDFRAGIDCDSRNEFTRTSLCHTLLQEWGKSPNHDPQLLVQAKEQCDKALEINPDFIIAAVNTGYILYQQGNHAGALRYFDEISQKYRTNSALFLNYGFLLYREYLADNNSQTLRQATAQTLQAWNLDANSDIAANNLGYFYYEQGDYPRAVEFWKKANTLNPTEPDSIAGLALGSYKLGQVPAATTFLSQAVQIDPNYRDPTALRKNNYWSARASSDLARLVKLLPAP